MTTAAKLAAELGAPTREIDGRRVPPMLCSQDETALRVLTQPGFVYELKLDGVRIVADKRGSDVSLAYRKQRDATASYPEIAAAIAALPEPRLVLDGEIVAWGEDGTPDFQRLAQRIHVSGARRDVGVVYVVFDILAIGDRDLRGLPLEARKAILARAVPDGDLLRVHPTFQDGDALFRLCREKGLEGVVAKRSGSIYRPGERAGDWVKVKHEHEADLVVVGWTAGEGKRERLGALDVAAYEEGRFVVRGAVGSGLDEDTIDLLLARLAALDVPKPAAVGAFRPGKKRRYVRPELVVSVRYMMLTGDGVLRFPVFRGIRADVRPEDCTLGDLPENAALYTYYERALPALLPYVAGRPCRVTGRTTRDVVLDGPEGLRAAIRGGAVSLRVEASDWLVLATDARGAEAVREVTHAIGLPAFPKHGERGLEVVVPVGDAPRDVARALGALVARLASDAAGREVALATGTIAPWAVLPDGARVAIPLAWDELGRAPPALGDADLEHDPMRPVLEAEVDVGRAAQALERYVAER